MLEIAKGANMAAAIQEEDKASVQKDNQSHEAIKTNFEETKKEIAKLKIASAQAGHARALPLLLLAAARAACTRRPAIVTGSAL